MPRSVTEKVIVNVELGENAIETHPREGYEVQTQFPEVAINVTNQRVLPIAS